MNGPTVIAATMPNRLGGRDQQRDGENNADEVITVRDSRFVDHWVEQFGQHSGAAVAAQGFPRMRS
jgi:hypothetical protein